MRAAFRYPSCQRTAIRIYLNGKLHLHVYAMFFEILIICRLLTVHIIYLDVGGAGIRCMFILVAKTSTY
jgi:hypothetical protein